ncbi:helix-turn-helix transcriptional regulator [Sedimentitalea sp. XS_ASV28]|uniref:helix-turn-helix transcriptional regulator n=1 Tax=Sedimentitalea sp. XS_ASV28 TaxID=3241296 RepID=UPI0035179873
MPRSSRLFEIIQILRVAEGPVTAADLADQLEVSVRTIYRDIAALQGMRTPIEGEAGMGYLMRKGYDLPPLNFDTDEIEALRVALAMLARTGDSALQRAAQRVCGKIDALHGPADWLEIVPWGAPSDDSAPDCVSKAMLRTAIREESKLELLYRDENNNETRRVVRPLVLIYHLNCVMLAAWCETRSAFRHFRTDRIWDCTLTGTDFTGEGAVLRRLWREQYEREGTQVGTAVGG